MVELEDMGLSWGEASAETQDHDMWKKLTAAKYPTRVNADN